MMWKDDPNVETARKLEGWAAFHRACGQRWLYFDHIERQGGRRGDYGAVAFTLVGTPRRTVQKVAEGRGKTVITALAAAYAAAAETGLIAAEAAPFLALLVADEQTPAPAASETIDIEELLG